MFFSSFYALNLFVALTCRTIKTVYEELKLADMLEEEVDPEKDEKLKLQVTTGSTVTNHDYWVSTLDDQEDHPREYKEVLSSLADLRFT